MAGFSIRHISVLGAGRYGTALAQCCAKSGLQVTLWARNTKQVSTINDHRYNPRYLESFRLHPNIGATSDLATAIQTADACILAVPSHAIRTLLENAKPWLNAKTNAQSPIICSAKGIEQENLQCMHEVTQDVLGPQAQHRFFVLSGPSFAIEMMQEHPTALVLAGHNQQDAKDLSEALRNPTFRIYHSDDVWGVQLGGALKNVVAIAAGAAHGMKLGHNARASLITRGLAEITRIAVAKGAKASTLSGLAGLGDLILTCTTALSRNQQFGVALGEGQSPEQAAQTVDQVVEGYRTTLAAKRLSDRLNVHTSIIDTQYRVLYEGLSTQEALTELLHNPPSSE